MPIKGALMASYAHVANTFPKIINAKSWTHAPILILNINLNTVYNYLATLGNFQGSYNFEDT